MNKHTLQKGTALVVALVLLYLWIQQQVISTYHHRELIIPFLEDLKMNQSIPIVYSNDSSQFFFNQGFDRIGCNMSELMMADEFHRHVSWNRTKEGSLEMFIANCSLDVIDRDFARKVVEASAGLGFIGDSLTRYQYLNLVYFLETGMWRSEEPENSLENKHSSWNDFYATTNQRLAGHEICDCFRGVTSAIENRYYIDGSSQVKYFQMFGNQNRILIHNVSLLRQGLCQPGRCSDLIEPVRDLGTPLQTDAIYGLLSNNRDNGHVFLNAGLWWLENSVNAFTSTQTKLLEDEIGKFHRDNEVQKNNVKLHWKMTTACKLGNHPEYQFVKTMVKSGVFHSFFDSWALTADIIKLHPEFIWDNFHFYWPVYRGLNLALIAYLAYLI